MKALYVVIPAAVFGAWLFWTLGILVDASRTSVWQGPYDFAKSGMFGDSFGGFSALMAALAAAGALLTLQVQRREAAQQTFNTNLFTLLSNFTSVVEDTDIHNFIYEDQDDGTRIEQLNYIWEGRDAYRVMLGDLRSRFNTEDLADLEITTGRYEQFFTEHRDDLGHYFRILYHLFRYIDESCKGDKDYYSRIVRAHLSNSELFLVAYNCICGEGKTKFVKLAEKYSILHNLGFDTEDLGVAEEDFIRGNLSDVVFSSKSEIAERSALLAKKEMQKPA